MYIKGHADKQFELAEALTVKWVMTMNETEKTIELIGDNDVLRAKCLDVVKDL